ncbi:HEPN domain-containing protein [Stenotrophomonas maltophilia]|uniref:HEPN domain-containing protein n=2 Tax=Stenotrophomonas maltophilia TaxID=40324 RepID=UPI002AB09B7D|nr:HEPN domain-containing protein [Stenotrophomonas maltophilia]MCF3470774.1 hypothetical protein [Stenotrophomonas maltophilia]MCF3503749.1 hypothetical protein [Stenotrophomonas maltophilia]
MSVRERLSAPEQEGMEALSRLRLIVDFIDESRPPPDLRVTMTNSIIVSTLSTAEEAFREVFIEALNILEQNVPTHDHLNNQLKKANSEKSVDLIKRLLKEGRKADASLALSGLSKCLNSEPGYKLASSELTDNKGNFRSSQLTDISKSLGINEIWKLIADGSAVTDFLGGETNIERATAVLINEWNSLFDERDLIVHRVSRASGWGSERVKEAIELAQLVLSRLAAVLEREISTAVAPWIDSSTA